MLPLADTVYLKRFPSWVITIIFANLFVFYLEATSSNLDIFIIQFSLIPSLINFGNLSTLFPFISSQFLHGGFLHFISNMLFLWVFGRNVEARLGFALFPVFYIASGIVAGLAQYLINPFSSIPVLGASGAIAGILGAYFAFFPNHRIKTLVFIFLFVTMIEIPAWIMLFYWFATQIINTAEGISLLSNQGGIAYIAHISGFLAGWTSSKIFFSRSVVHNLRFH